MNIELLISPIAMAGESLSLLDICTYLTLSFRVSLSHKQKLVTSSSGILLLMVYLTLSKPKSFLILSTEVYSMFSN